MMFWPILLLFVQGVSAWHEIFQEAYPQEYVGCFKDDESNRTFSVAPGDYIVDNLTPIQCMIVCGISYEYAAVQNGRICLCADGLPQETADDAQCDATCSGYTTTQQEETGSASAVSLPACGGGTVLSVYTIMHRILGLTLKNVTTLTVLTQETIAAELTNGKNITYVFDFGDGDHSHAIDSHWPNTSHVFDRPGTHVITVTASNRISGSENARKVVEVVDREARVQLTCERGTVVGRFKACTGAMATGSNIVVNIDFSDGHMERLRLSAWYSHVGFHNVGWEPDGTLDGHRGYTVVMPALEFSVAQYVSHWEVDAVSAGVIYLQVFRPVCRNHFVYCLTLGRCYDASAETCSSQKEHRCQDGELFCFIVGRCIPANSQISSCRIEQRSVEAVIPSTNFQLVYQMNITAPSRGHHLFKVDHNALFRTSPGDMIGWTRPVENGGSLASNSNVNGTLEYHYSAVNTIDDVLDDSIYLRHTSGVHAIAAHFQAPATFFLEHNYTHAGAYVISGNYTDNTVTYVDEPISNVSFVVEPSLLIGLPFTLSIAPHVGSNITYTWEFSDDQVVVSQDPNMTFTYNNVGTHGITLTASNSVSNVSAVAVVTVYEAIDGLAFVGVNEAIALGDTADVMWTLQRGSNITYEVSVNGAPSDSPMISASSSGVLNFTIPAATFHAIGEYIVSVSASNEINSATISRVLSVQVLVDGVKISSSTERINDIIYVATGDAVPFDVTLESGSNYTCTFHFSDSSPPSSMLSLDAPIRIERTFTGAGTFEVNVTCNNSISSVTSQFDTSIIAQILEPITGLFLKVNSTVLGQSSRIVWGMRSGTVLSCLWHFGDNASLITGHSMLPFPVLHTYSRTGDFTVVVSCQNALGNETQTINVAVAIRIGGLQLQCPPTFANVSTGLSYVALLQNGSDLNVGLMIDGLVVETKEHDASEGTSIAFSHSFTTPGVFNVSVSAANSLNTIIKACSHEVRVQVPVSDFTVTSDSPVKLSSGVVSYRVVFISNDEVALPTDAIATWLYGDDTTDRDHVVAITPMRSHGFNLAGRFTTTVTISNNVSSVTGMCTVEVQRMQSVNISVIALPLFEPGIGVDRNIFVVGQSIRVNVTQQRHDLYYVFTVDDGSHDVNTTVPEAEFSFPIPGKRSITARVVNLLEVYIVQLEIIVVRPIEDVHFYSTEAADLGNVVDVEISAKSLGSHTCLFVDMDDGNVRMYHMVQECHAPEVTNETRVTSYPLQSDNVTFNYTYSKTGDYNITVTVVNPVSEMVILRGVIISHRPCVTPDVVIFQGGNATHPTAMRKSDRIVISANITADCVIADHVIVRWRMHHVTLTAPYDAGAIIPLTNLRLDFNVSSPLVITSQFDPTRLDIPALTLPYGIVRLRLSVAFDNDRDEPMDDVLGVNTVWFDVQPTPLLANIHGGFSRAVGFEVWLRLDASPSYDPDDVDDQTGGLSFTWYCRLENEGVFTDDGTVTNPSGGCFQDGVYELAVRNNTVKQLTDSGDVIEVFTGALAQMTTYVFRVAVTKGTRRSVVEQRSTILPGNPPTMNTICKLNCNSKINPAGRLVVEGYCSDCSVMTTLSYSWDLLELAADGGDPVAVQGLAKKTTTGVSQSNIAIKEGVLRAGRVYLLQVTAWKAGGTKETGGFTVYRFTANMPPQGGLCDVEPRSGFTLETKFKIFCQNWQDEDTPLFYIVDAIRGEQRSNLYKGVANEAELILPLGDQALDFEYQIFVSVMDKFDFATEIQFPVQVKEPSNVDMNRVTSGLDALTGEGSEQELAQTALAAGSIMNKNSDASSGAGNAEARSKILQSVSRTSACDIDSIKQYGDVFKEMTDKPDEISEDAQDTSSDSMARMSKCMLAADAKDSGMASAAESVFLASANLLAVSQQAAKLNNSGNATLGSAASTRRRRQIQSNATATTITLPTNSSATKAANKVFGVIDNVGGSLSRQMVTGDKPTKVTTPNMDLQVGQVSDDADEEETGFKLPSVSALAGNSSEGAGTSIGAVKTSMKDSPFGGAADDDINSDIQGLALTDGNGNPVDLAGQDIEMYIPRDTSYDLPPDMHFFDETTRMKVHKFNYTNENSGLAIEVRPVDALIRFQVYINYGSRPTLLNSSLNYSLPTLQEAAVMKKLPNPFTYVFGKGKLNTSGEYFIGIRVMNSAELYGSTGYLALTNYTVRVFEATCKVWDDDGMVWTTKGCEVGPKTTFNKTHCVCRLGEEEVDDHAVPTDDPSAPKFGKLTSADAAVSTPKRIIRKPVKRVSLAGGLFPAPNPIDFSKAFAGFANLAENPIAFSVVLSIFGLYLFLLFWARREDRKDIERAGVTVLDDNDPSDRQFFEVTVFTGFGSGASTTSNVYIQLLGEDGETEPRELCDTSRKMFQRRGEDVFLVSVPDRIGALTYLRVWHSNSGKSPSWYLRRVTVRDVASDQKYLFINECFLAVESGSGEVDKLLPVAGPDEITSFNNLFYTTTTKNLSDGHIWFSIFIRPAKSRFTRVQRLSCCLTLLYCTMIANAMFYNVGGESDTSNSVTLGPFSFSLAQIGIGIMSSLVVFPVNVLIVTIFRAVGPKPSRKELKKRRSKSWWWLRELLFCFTFEKERHDFMNIIATVPDVAPQKKKAESPIELDVMSCEDSSGVENGEIMFKFEQEKPDPLGLNKKKSKKPPRRLPYWMKYLAWLVLILTSFTSAFFVVLYGFQFGKETSAQFLSSLMISFLQDVLISQPIKILFLGLFIALVVKKPEEEVEEGGNDRKSDEEFLHGVDAKPIGERKRPSGIIRFQPPPKAKIRAAREYRLKEIKMYGVIREIVLYFLFVISLCIVSYSHLDPSSFAFGSSLRDTFVDGVYGGAKNFHQISSHKDVWLWLNTTVANGLYSTHWYNGAPNEPGFTQDLYANAFGGARLRQLRVKPDSCSIPSDVTGTITTCNDWYDFYNEDTGHYDPRWLPVHNESLYSPHKSYSSWEYFSSEELNSYPFVGSMASYAGGGYIADLGKYPQRTREVVTDLSSLGWLDTRSRALFLEISVYNAQVNLFGIMNFLVEFLPTNGIVTFQSVKIARLYTFGGGNQSLVLACQAFVLLFLFVFLYRELKKIYRLRKKYFHGFWNWMEVATIILVITTVGLFFSRLLLVNSAVKSIQDNPGQFVSFNKVAAWDNMFVYVSSILVMVSCIKSIRLLSFNRTIAVLASTLRGCAVPLGAFSIVFLVFFLSYVQWSFVMFVNHLEEYRSFIVSMESTMSLMLGNYNFRGIVDSQRILGPIYFITLVVFGVFYIMNVFLSIIMDTYADVKDDEAKQDKDHEIVDFMVAKFKRWMASGDVQKAHMGSQENEKITESAPPPTRTRAGGRTRRQQKQQMRFDDVIAKKFKELDDSLFGACADYYTDDSLIGELVAKSAGGSAELDYDAIVEEQAYQQELQAELEKWQ